MKSLSLARLALAIGFVILAAATSMTVVGSQRAAACIDGVNC